MINSDLGYPIVEVLQGNGTDEANDTSTEELDENDIDVEQVNDIDEDT